MQLAELFWELAVGAVRVVPEPLVAVAAADRAARLDIEFACHTPPSGVRSAPKTP